MTNEKLVYQIRNGEDFTENMLQLWNQNQGIIHQIARRYQAMADLEDLLQESYIGLHEAVQHYDQSVGVPFVTYAAFWIRQACSRYSKMNKSVRLPEHVQNRVRAYKKMVAKWQSEFGRKPTEWEISRYLEVSLSVAHQIEKEALTGQIQSLDTPVGDDEEGDQYELLPGADNVEADVLDQVQQEQLRDVIWSTVDSLPGQHPAVIRMRFQHGLTLKETGKALSMTGNQARDLQNKAMRELRKPNRIRKLIPYMNDQIQSIALHGNGVGSFRNSGMSSTERAAFWSEQEIERELIMMRHGCMHKIGI